MALADLKIQNLENGGANRIRHMEQIPHKLTMSVSYPYYSLRSYFFYKRRKR